MNWANSFRLKWNVLLLSSITNFSSHSLSRQMTNAKTRPLWDSIYLLLSFFSSLFYFPLKPLFNATAQWFLNACQSCGMQKKNTLQLVALQVQAVLFCLHMLSPSWQELFNSICLNIAGERIPYCSCTVIEKNERGKTGRKLKF